MMKTEYADIQIFNPDARYDIAAFGELFGLHDSVTARSLFEGAAAPYLDKVSGFEIGTDGSGRLVQREKNVHGEAEGIPFVNTSCEEILTKCQNMIDMQCGGNALSPWALQIIDFCAEKPNAEFYTRRCTDRRYAPVAKPSYDPDTNCIKTIYPPVFLSFSDIVLCMSFRHDPEKFYKETISACPKELAIAALHAAKTDAKRMSKNDKER